MSSEQILPTKIFLMELRNKLMLIKFAKKILERKRDSLREAIKQSIGFMEEIIKFLKKGLLELISKIVMISIQYGDKLEAYSAIQTEKLMLDVRYIPTGGVTIPKIVVVSKPTIRDRYPEGLRASMYSFYENIKDIIYIPETIAALELLLKEIETTNRIVNTLEKVVIPDLQEKITYIVNVLSEAAISELASLRTVLSYLGVD